MTQKTIVMTGASDGIGLEAASQLAARGHHLVVVGRNPEKTAQALERVRRADPEAASYLVDMGDLAAVRELAAELANDLPVIDVLCNNAGTVFAKRHLTKDGFEATFAVNHLGPFLFTELLRDHLAPDARVVNTASGSHYTGTMDFDDLGYENGYQIMRAYGRSKLANVLYTRELARQFDGTMRTANCLHPGTVATSIWTGAPAFAKPILSVAKRFMTTAEDGGSRITFLADSPEVAGESGGYYDNNRIKTPSKLALDDALAQRLYAESRRMVGLDGARTHLVEPSLVDAEPSLERAEPSVRALSGSVNPGVQPRPEPDTDAKVVVNLVSVGSIQLKVVELQHRTRDAVVRIASA